MESSEICQVLPCVQTFWLFFSIFFKVRVLIFSTNSIEFEPCDKMLFLKVEVTLRKVHSYSRCHKIKKNIKNKHKKYY